MSEVGDAEREQADMEELRITYRKWQEAKTKEDWNKYRDAFLRLCERILK